MLFTQPLCALTESHSSQSRMPTFAFLKKVLRMALASQQLPTQEVPGGTSVQPVGRGHPVTKSGAPGFPHKPHLPCRLGRGYPAVYFSGVF